MLGSIRLTGLMKTFTRTAALITLSCRNNRFHLLHPSHQCNPCTRKFDASNSNHNDKFYIEYMYKRSYCAARKQQSSIGVRRCYSEWVKPGVPSTQFVADLEGKQYKTSVSILNQEAVEDDLIFVDRYSTLGFTLNNGMRILGPCALFPRTTLHWNIAGVEEITAESLTLFTILEPKIDILIVGVGQRELLANVDSELYASMKRAGISLEILPTEQACATFNFLNDERRYVAAALLPPTRMKVDPRTFYMSDNLETGWSLTDGPYETEDRIENIFPSLDKIKLAEEKASKSLPSSEKDKSSDDDSKKF